MDGTAARQHGGQATGGPSRPSGERQGGGRPGGKPSSGSGAGAGSGPGSSAVKAQDAGRTRKHAGRYTGWNDGVDRVWCAARVQEPAATFPVHSRVAATRPVVIVDRRETEVLLCDGEHWGDHRWPHLPMDECPEE